MPMIALLGWSLLLSILWAGGECSTLNPPRPEHMIRFSERSSSQAHKVNANLIEQQQADKTGSNVTLKTTFSIPMSDLVEKQTNKESFPASQSTPITTNITQPSSITTTGSSNSQPSSTSISLSSTSKSPPFSHLFRSFSFRGFGLSLSKSLTDIRSVGWGIKIPITPNFPAYDSVVYLPRVNAFLGFSFPLSIRLSLSFTIPIQVILAVIVALHQLSQWDEQQQLQKQQQQQQQSIKGVDDIVSAEPLPLPTASFPAIVWPKIQASDSVQRIGFSIAFRYNPKYDYHLVLGPYMLYLPDLESIEKLLPVIIFLPAVVYGGYLLGLDKIEQIGEIGREMLRRLLLLLMGADQQQQLHEKLPILHTQYHHHIQQQQQQQYAAATAVDMAATTVLTPNKPVELLACNSSPPSLLLPSLTAYSTVAQQPSSTTKRKKRLINSHPQPYQAAYLSIHTWLMKMSPTFGTNLGYYNYLQHCLMMGSSVYFDIQPFFPFARQWKQLVKYMITTSRKQQQQKKKKQAMTAAAAAATTAASDKSEL